LTRDTKASQNQIKYYLAQHLTHNKFSIRVNDDDDNDDDYKMADGRGKAVTAKEAAEGRRERISWPSSTL
jgi:hypothetical protein